MTTPTQPDPLIDPFETSHANSDADLDSDSLHHTLGYGPQQAAPGNHGGHAPVGSLVMYAGNTVPTKYLLCDGAAVARTTYKDLFAVIGTTYGVGDGSTTFNLPNFTNRVPRGNTLASSGGSDSHGHSNSTTGASVGALASASTNVGVGPGTNVAATAHGHGLVDGGHGHGSGSNIPAYVGIAFLIRYS